MEEPFVHKVFTGKVKTMGDPQATNPMDREWQSGIFKKEKSDQLWLTKTGLEGDEIADKKVHGGPEKALFAYPIKHYTHWKKDLNNEDIDMRSEEHTSELQSRGHLVCRLLLEKK